MMPIITGKTVNIKILDESDIEQVRQWRNMADVSDFMISQTYISQEQQINWYKRIKDDLSSIYWVILSKEEIKLGLVSLTKIDRLNHEAEPGLYIGDKKNRNSFFGIEAYAHLLNHGFSCLKLKRIYGTVLSTNITAIKMNSSLGFVTESIIKDGILIGGILIDIHKIELFRNHFYESPMAKFFKMNKPG